MSTYRICFDQAVEYIKAYKNEFYIDQAPSLGSVPPTLGGTLELDLLRDETKNFPDNYVGYMIWLCWQKEVSMTDTLFFPAIEKNDKVDSDWDQNRKPRQETLSRPFDLLRFDPSTDHDIVHLLKTHGNPIGRPPRVQRDYDVKIDRGVSGQGSGVIPLKESFGQNGPRNDDGKPYNEFNYLFFESEAIKDFNELILERKDVKYLRYYFGFDEKRDYNKIRIILMGTNDQYENLLPDTKDKVVESEHIILQESWPPELTDDN